jgi:hypothetical protein
MKRKVFLFATLGFFAIFPAVSEAGMNTVRVLNMADAPRMIIVRDIQIERTVTLQPGEGADVGTHAIFMGLPGQRLMSAEPGEEWVIWRDGTFGVQRTATRASGHL